MHILSFMHANVNIDSWSCTSLTPSHWHFSCCYCRHETESETETEYETETETETEIETIAHVHAIKNKIWHINCTLRRVHINHHECVQGYTSYEHVPTPSNIIVAHAHIDIQVGKCWHRLMIIYMPQKYFFTHQLHSTQIAYWSSWTCKHIHHMSMYLHL